MSFSKILFIRRDNIGDLICTTPAIHAVREKFSLAKIGILVNTYNADVIMNNPDIDEVYIYEKAKHAPDKSKFSVWWNNFKILQKIRKERYDVAIGCGSYSPRLARYTFLTGAKIRTGYCRRDAKCFFYNKPVIQLTEDMHEVIKTFDLVRILGIDSEPGEMVLIPDSSEQERFGIFKTDRLKETGKPLLAVAISVRIKRNKWPMEKFMAFIEKMLVKDFVNILLLWAPGSKYNPVFPGDDELADIVISHFGQRITAYPTPALKSLVAAISLSDFVVTLDTGSLHMAAALKKPTVALMTKDKAKSWYPWKTKNIVVTSKGNVEDISVEDVFQAVEKLLF